MPNTKLYFLRDVFAGDIFVSNLGPNFNLADHFRIVEMEKKHFMLFHVKDEPPQRWVWGTESEARRKTQ